MEKIIEDFFKNLKIENKYYSLQLKQPVFLVGEKYLYEAVKKIVRNFQGSCVLKIKEKSLIEEIKKAVFSSSEEG